MSYLIISFDSSTNIDDEVSITGSFNHWSEKLPLKREDKHWEFHLDPKDVTEPLVFKFVIKSPDGSENWCCSDVYQKVTDESGNENNVVDDLKRLQTKDTSTMAAENTEEKKEEVVKGHNDEQVDIDAKNKQANKPVDSESDYENDQSSVYNDTVQSTVDNKAEEFNPFIDKDFQLHPTSPHNLTSSDTPARLPHQNISHLVHISSVKNETTTNNHHEESPEQSENPPKTVAKVLYAFPWFFKFLFLRLFGYSNNYFSVRRFMGQLFGFINKPSENNNNE
ncbi:BA75_01709T0 [Komagataella pastoris]|uniref:BA75_01709T0 n=1 Tax=Komagataella pastoris TaxID=4922 RepID=A0A1B2J8C0_PICPA|nr:BA75_01709T0 [Komagataella pastoris]